MPYPSPPFAHLSLSVGLPRWRSGKESACQCRRHRRHRFNAWVAKIPWRKKWWPTQIFLPGKSHGQRSLAGYSPWGCKESDTTEWLTLSFSLLVIWGLLLGPLYQNLLTWSPPVLWLYPNDKSCLQPKPPSSIQIVCAFGQISIWLVKKNLKHGSITANFNSLTPPDWLYLKPPGRWW